MAEIKINGNVVLDLVMTQPRVGTWFADAQIIGKVDVSGPVLLTDGVMQYAGATVRTGANSGRTFARIVGGAGGLSTTIGPAHYQSAPAGKIIGDICRAAKETKSLLIDPRILLKKMPYWSRTQGTAGAALSEIADALEVVWRVLPTGGVWFGDPDFAVPAARDYLVLDQDPLDGRYTIAIDGLGLIVGMTQSTGIVRRIEYAIDNRARARYWVD